MGFPGGSDSKKLACNTGTPRFHPWVRKSPWRRQWQPTPVFLPGESHGQRNLMGYSPWGCKRVRHNWATNTHTHTIVWSSQVVQCRRLPVNAEDSKNAGLIPGLGRFPREGNGNPLQYSCLENPMDRGTWWATVHGVAKESDKTEWLALYRLPIPISFLWQACEVKEREVIFRISPRTINPESETANCPSIHHVTLFLFLEPHFEGEIQEHYLVSSVQSISRVWFFATPWTAARQASLSITNSRSSPKLLPSSHLILCRPLLLLPPIPPSIRVFSNESTLRVRWPSYWSFSFSISPSKDHPGLISFRMDWLDLLAVQGTVKSLFQHHSSKASILQGSAFFTVQLSHPYMTTGKTLPDGKKHYWTSLVAQR